MLDAPIHILIAISGQAFVQKHDIFTQENNMLSLPAKRSPLLHLHDESNFPQ